MRVELNAHWEVRSSHGLAVDGALISSPSCPREGWHETTLPATVLSALVRAGALPDPFPGDALRTLPGAFLEPRNFANFEMPGDSPFRVAWWYRRIFRVPEGSGERVRLAFDGINYRANVWLNGTQVADATRIVGAYREHELDVTALVDRVGDNVVAVEVFPPGPHDLAITWVDWNPAPPDKNMGLWRDAWLLTSGDVAIVAPHVVTRLCPDGTARLEVRARLKSFADVARAVSLRVELLDRRLERTLWLAPRAEIDVSLSAEQRPELCVRDPELWWPRQLGGQPLFALDLEATVDGRVSDRSSTRFGMREITCETTELGHAQFKVNGRPLLIRGAGWAGDLLMRHSKEREQAELSYVVDLGLNALRFEGMLERERFLARCDELGILVIAGWCCGDHWEKWDAWAPADHDIAAESLRSELRRVRSHACMAAFWYGSDFPPPAAVERRYLDVVASEAWPNPTHSSATQKLAELSGSAGVKMLGPYDYVPPSYWLRDTERGGAFGFATEVGPGAAVPPVQSLRKMLPAGSLWPIDEAWSRHAGLQEFHQISVFADALAARYGEPKDLDDFVRKAQLLCYDGQRAMFEAYARNRPRATGVIQWMLNNAWPSLIWHLYDWYLRPAGGYFGAKKALEPLHVQWAWDDDGISVVNEQATPARALTVTATLLDAGGAELWHGSATVDAPSCTTTRALTLPPGSRRAPLTFLDLALTDENGTVRSRNFYWIAAEDDELSWDQADWRLTPCRKHADLSALSALPAAEVTARLVGEPFVDGRERRARVSLHAGTTLAFFVELRLADARTLEDVLPVVYEDNYVTLRPGQRREIEVHWPASGDSDVVVEVSGWNVAARTVEG